MNRKQRRAAFKRASTAGGSQSAQLFADALRAQQQNKIDDAVRAYKRLLLLVPDHAEANNNLACMLQAQGKLAEASARFARALELMPQLFDQFGAICNTLLTVLPALTPAIRQASEVWPRRMPLHQLLGDKDLAVVSADPLLLTILRSSPVRDLGLERLLTVLRATLLDGTANSSITLAFRCALAQQCFINEYVFATTPVEEARIQQIKNNLHDIAPMRLATLAMYVPLDTLADAKSLLDRSWPEAIDDVVTQQVREPVAERTLRASIPRLTAIDDDVSLRVQQQYEENPYPRWMHVAGNVETQSIDEYLRTMIPGADFVALGERPRLDVLVAGCGTGAHPIELARKIANADVLAIDLSLSSLAYAKRKTPDALASRLSYGQADILKLGTLGRSFDVIDASGVLHHMADPTQGLCRLLPLLRSGGLMHLGLYSKVARRDVTAARNFIAQKDYCPTPDGIRRARQDILASDLRGVARAADFFSMSECRDLLFHVQEHQLTIPEIKALLAENGLAFIGFVFDMPRAMHYASVFAQIKKSIADLDAWHEFETLSPDTFSGMYQFWVQKT